MSAQHDDFALYLSFNMELNDRVFVSNDPVNLIDPEGLAFIDRNRNYGKHPMGSPPPSKYSPQKSEGFLGIPSMQPMEERTQRAKDVAKWNLDRSGIRETLNAGPLHPIMWEKNMLWMLYGFWPGYVADGEGKFFEPWGHPYWGGHEECH